MLSIESVFNSKYENDYNDLDLINGNKFKNILLFSSEDVVLLPTYYHFWANRIITYMYAKRYDDVLSIIEKVPFLVALPNTNGETPLYHIRNSLNEISIKNSKRACHENVVNFVNQIVLRSNVFSNIEEKDLIEASLTPSIKAFPFALSEKGQQMTKIILATQKDETILDNDKQDLKIFGESQNNEEEYNEG